MSPGFVAIAASLSAGSRRSLSVSPSACCEAASSVWAEAPPTAHGRPARQSPLSAWLSLTTFPRLLSSAPHEEEEGDDKVRGAEAGRQEAGGAEADQDLYAQVAPGERPGAFPIPAAVADAPGQAPAPPGAQRCVAAGRHGCPSVRVAPRDGRGLRAGLPVARLRRGGSCLAGGSNGASSSSRSSSSSPPSGRSWSFRIVFAAVGRRINSTAKRSSTVAPLRNAPESGRKSSTGTQSGIDGCRQETQRKTLERNTS